MGALIRIGVLIKKSGTQWRALIVKEALVESLRIHHGADNGFTNQI